MKQYLLLVWLVGATSLGFSQSSAHRVGFELQSGISSMHGPGVSPQFTDIRVSSSAKVTYSIPLEDGLWVQTGLGYALKGYRTDIEAVPDFTGEYFDRSKTSFRYAMIPMVLMVELGENRRLFVEGGGYGALLLGASREGESSSDGSYKAGISGFFRTLDYGFLGGGGLQFPVREHGRLMVGLRAEYGMQNVTERARRRDAHRNWAAYGHVTWSVPVHRDDSQP